MRREMQSVRLRGKIDFFLFFFPRFEKKERERDFVSPGCRRNSMTLETKEKQETRGRGGGERNVKYQKYADPQAEASFRLDDFFSRMNDKSRNIYTACAASTPANLSNNKVRAPIVRDRKIRIKTSVLHRCSTSAPCDRVSRMFGNECQLK